MGQPDTMFASSSVPRHLARGRSVSRRPARWPATTSAPIRTMKAVGASAPGAERGRSRSRDELPSWCDPARRERLARLDVVTDLTRVPTAPLLAAGLVGGFALAQRTGVRPLGGAAMLGANVVAALRLAERLGPEATVATIIVDSGLRYLSTDIFRS